MRGGLLRHVLMPVSLLGHSGIEAKNLADARSCDADGLRSAS
ncbi:MAG: hypothetical protein OXI97_03240 [Acidimicrobiaceae bacterium]|nr:hypothetical protein [Acidimicrobiaceae bacterium]